MLNYYRILDVPQSASMNDIKRAYRTKVLRWHPDKNPDNRKEAEQKFKEIVEAYKVLSDKSTRDHYDENKKDTFKESKKPKHEKTLSVFVQDGIKIFFTGQRSSSDFSVSFFSAPKRFHHFSIMTAFINGKKITTKRHLENESKYLEVEEDGKTVSIHVNGIPVYDREFNGPSGSFHWNCRVDKGRFRPDRWRFWTCERLRWAEEWRRWANKWRDWAEECRDWAEGRQSTNIRGNAKHYKANANEHPKASPDHFRSDKYCPKSGGKLSGFSMPGEEKGHSKEGNSKINKGPTRPEEEHSNLSKGYFMFPKPGEKTSEMDDGHPRSSKGQHKPEEGNLSPNVGINRLREGPSRQDEGHHRIKKGKPKPDDGQARPGKVPLGLQKSDPKCSASKNSEPMDNEISKQHISECNSQAEISEPHIEKEEPRFEENIFYAMKCENLEKKAPECEKLGTEGQKGCSTLVSELVSKAELHCQIKKNFAGHKVASETFSTIGLPMKRREAQIWARKLYSKRNKPQTRMKRRNKPQAGKYRIPDGHSRQELDEKVFSENRQMTPDGKMSPADSKCDPPNSKKGPLPPLQKGDTLPQTRKRFLRRRVHHPLSETQHERLHSVSETNQLLNTHGQQQRKLKKLPQSSEQLPGIEGQKVGKNQHPDVNR